MFLSKIKSLLIIGPTGAGKSPLGKVLEKRGLEGLKIHHFDFGENLRKAEKGELKLPKEERELISKILCEGRLLKPEEFFLAEKLLFSFLKERV